MSAHLPPPKCCICLGPIEDERYVERGHWAVVAHVACADEQDDAMGRPSRGQWPKGAWPIHRGAALIDGSIAPESDGGLADA